MGNKAVKTYADTYIYKTNHDYDKKIFEYLISGAIIDKTSEVFRDAVHEVKKRAVSIAFIDCMESANVVFIKGDIAKPFKVMMAKDVRRRATHENYVNEYVASLAEAGVKNLNKNRNVDNPKAATGLNNPMNPKTGVAVHSNGNVVYDENFIPYSPPPIVFKEDVLVNAPLKCFINADSCFDRDRFTNPEIMIAYLNSAIVNLMYYKMPQKLFNYNNLNFGSACFCKLFLNILELMCKISSMDDSKAKCHYAISKYFHTNVAYTIEGGKRDDTFTDSVRKRCINDAALSERQAAIVDANIPDDNYDNIKLFIESLSDMIRIPSLTIDAFIERWMWIYGGPSTAFALEYYPSFSEMVTHAYHGVYLNNQKTIEKVCGNNMVGYTKGIINSI